MGGGRGGGREGGGGRGGEGGGGEGGGGGDWICGERDRVPSPPGLICEVHEPERDVGGVVENEATKVCFSASATISSGIKHDTGLEFFCSQQYTVIYLRR